jgi:hypothetical protein
MLVIVLPLITAPANEVTFEFAVTLHLLEKSRVTATDFAVSAVSIAPDRVRAALQGEHHHVDVVGHDVAGQGLTVRGEDRRPAVGTAFAPLTGGRLEQNPARRSP